MILNRLFQRCLGQPSQVWHVSYTEDDGALL